MIFTLSALTGLALTVVAAGEEQQRKAPLVCTKCANTSDCGLPKKKVFGSELEFFQCSQVTLGKADTTNVLESFQQKIFNLEQEINLLKSQLRSWDKSQESHPRAPQQQTGDDTNLVEMTMGAVVDSIKRQAKAASIRKWRQIEDYFLDSNRLQTSFKYLRDIIQTSYNSTRSNILTTLAFIDQLNRTSQKHFAIEVLVDAMNSSGHMQGKEIFSVGYYAGRSFDREHKIWEKFPQQVKLINTLWRLNWFVQHKNTSFALRFANPVNSPLEILTTNNVMEGADGPETSPDWHFVSTKTWHWVKVIGSQGYVKVDEATNMFVRDVDERRPTKLELSATQKETFHILCNNTPVTANVVFDVPFAFIPSNQGQPAEFFVRESVEAPGSRILDLYD